MSPCRGRRASTDTRCWGMHVDVHAPPSFPCCHHCRAAYMHSSTRPCHSLACSCVAILIVSRALITCSRSRHPHALPAICDKATTPHTREPSPTFGLALAPPQTTRTPFPPVLPSLSLSPSTLHRPGPPVHPCPRIALALASNAE